MSTVISSLLRVKTEDDKYVIVLPIISANECFYDVGKKINIGTVVDEIKEEMKKTTINEEGSLISIKSTPGFYSNETKTGILAVELPEYYNNGIVSLEVTGYTNNNLWSIKATAQMSDVSTFSEPSFIAVGNPPSTNVRFAKKEGNIALIIGNEDTTWENALIVVKDIITTNAEWSDNYEISFVANMLPFSSVIDAVESERDNSCRLIREIVNGSDLSTFKLNSLYKGTTDIVDVFKDGLKLYETVDFNIEESSVVLTSEEDISSSVFEITIIRNVK